MAQLRLVVDRPTSDLWDDAERRAMLSAGGSISLLEWENRIAEGGLWQGKAKVRVLEDGPSWDRLVRGGATGLAWIYWDRDLSAADGLDEETDLLWFGVAEDARVSRDGNEVALRLRGAGQFLKQSTYTGDHEAESIHDIADAVLDSMIPVGSGGTGLDDTPVKAKDTDDAGTLSRKVSIAFDHTPVSRALKQLAALAGGPSRVAWGVRPATASSSFGVGYMKLWAGHLYEKEASTDRRMFTLERGQVASYHVEARNSDVRNVVTVIGDELGLDPDDTAREFHSATAECEESIKLYGRRAATIRDSSLQTDGQCALVAAGECQASASRRVRAKVKALVRMTDVVTVGASSVYGLVQTALKVPAKVVTVRDRNRPLRFWGDSQQVYHAERDASTARYLEVETASGPTGADLVIQDPATLGSGDKRLYEVTRVQTDNNYSTTGLYILEVDERLGLFYFPSGGAWKLGIGYKNSGGTWVSFGVSAATRSNAQIAAEHTVALEVAYQSGTNMGLAAYWGDGTTTTQMLTGALAYSSIYSTGTPSRILLNGMGSAGAAPLPAGDCSGADYSQLLVWRAWSGATATFLNNHGNQGPPFKRLGDLVLATNFGLTEGGAATDSGQARYAFGQTTRPRGWDAEPKNAGATSQFEDAATFTRRNHAWACGDDLAPAEYGTHLDLLPMRARFGYRGPDAPLSVKLEGEGGTRPASEAILLAAEAAAATEEITRKGVNG